MRICIKNTMTALLCLAASLHSTVVSASETQVVLQLFNMSLTFSDDSICSDPSQMQTILDAVKVTYNAEMQNDEYQRQISTMFLLEYDLPFCNDNRRGLRSQRRLQSGGYLGGGGSGTCNGCPKHPPLGNDTGGRRLYDDLKNGKLPSLEDIRVKQAAYLSKIGSSFSVNKITSGPLSFSLQLQLDAANSKVEVQYLTDFQKYKTQQLTEAEDEKSPLRTDMMTKVSLNTDFNVRRNLMLKESSGLHDDINTLESDLRKVEADLAQAETESSNLELQETTLISNTSGQERTKLLTTSAALGDAVSEAEVKNTVLVYNGQK